MDYRDILYVLVFYVLPLFVLGALLVWLLRRVPFFVRRLTIFEYERGLKYKSGRFSEVLGPGQYWINPFSTAVTKVDIRPALVTLSGQEVLTADGVAIKVNLVARYEVVDPVVAVNRVQSYLQALYTEVQLGLREVVATTTIEDFMARRGEVGGRLMELAAPKVVELGLRLIAAEVKDITFPGDLKKVFSQVVRARQEGLAALEKARGETAALRNLANAARLVEEKPALLQLRLLQQVGEGTSNTVVMGMPSNTTPLPLRERGSEPPRIAGPEPSDVDQG